MTALPFNKLCNIEDFEHPDLLPVLRDVCAYKRPHLGPSFPRGFEHRKDWEVAMAVRSLRDHGALRPDATLLGVAAGVEDTIFYLTRHARQVFATDRYLSPGAWMPLAPPVMLVEPQALSPIDFDVDRLVVQHMDGRCLRYPADTFDGIFSCGSIEHFGELLDSAHSAYEMGRVLKPGGILALSTEFRISGPEGGIGWPGKTLLFSAENVARYIVEASGLELVDPLDTSVSEATFAEPRDLGAAIIQVQQGEGPHYARYDFPHIILRHLDYVFTSIHLTLRKTDRHPLTSNEWARPTEATRAAISEYNLAAAQRPVAPDEAASEPPAATAGPADPPAGAGATGAWSDAVSWAVESRNRVESADRMLAEASSQLEAEVAATLGARTAAVEALADIDASLAEVAALRARVEATDEVRDHAPPAVDRRAWTAAEVTLGSGLTFDVLVDTRDADHISWSAAHGRVDETPLTLLRALAPPGAPVMDLGGHVGTFALAAARAGYPVIAVEASPANAALLRSSAARNGADVLVVEAAVSDRPGVLRFVPHGPWGHVAWSDPEAATVEVPAVRADDLLVERGWPSCAFLKIDVEGSELPALAGLARHLDGPEAPALYFEANGHTLAWTGATPEDLVAEVRRLGYTVYRVEPRMLVEIGPGEMQPMTLADHVAVKGRLDELEGWRILRPLAVDAIAERIVAECRSPNPDCRAYIGRALERFAEDIRARPDVGAAIRGLACDEVERVREAVGWWMPSPVATGVVQSGGR